MSADRQPLLRLRSATRSKKQKDRSSGSFKPKDLMLAEHNRTGPALAANPATFPLNDVDFCFPGDPQGTDQAAKPVCFRIITPPIRPSTRKGRGMVELDGIEPTT